MSRVTPVHRRPVAYPARGRSGRRSGPRRWHDRDMKYVVCVPDGCADAPTAMLGGRTPLEVADMPVLHDLARRGEVGRAAVIPPGMAICQV
ncbi:MAG: hypothetical protein U5R31_03980 [Acidimicrobiia bacterium]|nr:hypothetical protein [Acidimicrobiia bacterium]